jgi:hypothetical protein
MPLTRHQAYRLLTAWEESIRQWEFTLTEFDKLTLSSPESKIHAHPEAIIQAYTHALATILDCDTQELEWYRHETKFGRSPMDCKLPDGTTIRVRFLTNFIDTLLDPNGKPLYPEQPSSTDH